jgi:Spy/CpxP family protein refolding chaperone
MKRALLIILIALSVGLNMAFIAGWAVSNWPAWRFWGGAGQGPGASSSSNEIWHPMHRRLGIGRGRWQRLEPEVRQFYHDIQPIQRRINGLRRGLIDLLAQPQPNREAIQAKQQQILDEQARLQDRVVQQLLTEKQALTEPQQRQLFDLLRDHARRQPGHGLGPPDGRPHHERRRRHRGGQHRPNGPSDHR